MILASIDKVLEDVQGAWRFRWIALAVAAAVCVFGWLYVLSMPSIYEARARVYVDTQGVLRPLLQGLAIAPNVESGVAIVRQAMLSRPHIEKVARETGLDAGASGAKEREALVAALQQRIIIATAAAAAGGPTDGLYTITFQDQSRGKSLAVVQSLLNTFVEDTRGNKRTGQEEAQRFLKGEIAEYEKKLSESEERLAEFKKRNVGKMPDQRGDYFGRMQTANTALETSRNELAVAEARRDELQRQLNGEDPFVFGFDNELNGANAPAGQNGDLTARILELEKREQDLLLRYTDKHPEVVGVRKTLEDLKAQQAAEIERLKRGRGTGSMAHSTKANPVHQSLKLELNRADVQIAELRRTVAQRSSEVAELKNLVNTVPQVEADIARLNRDYDVTRAQYLQLVQRLQTAKISESADETGTVKFEVIDPPAVPLRPVAPIRPMLFTAVLVVGLLAGAGAAYVLNMLRPVFLNARLLAETTSLPVIGTVGRRGAVEFGRTRRQDLWRFCGGAAGLFALFIAISAFGERVMAALFGSDV